MAIALACPTCAREMAVPDILLGQTVKCPTCGGKFRAESGSVVAPVSRSGAPASEDVESAPADSPADPRITEPYVEKVTEAGSRAKTKQVTEDMTPPSAPEPATQVATCRCCAEEIPADVTFCPLCGEPLEGPLSHEIRPPRWLRRDCAPHRGNLIRNVGITGIVLGCASSFLCMLAPAIQIAGLICSITAWAMAHKDLLKMRAGVMDPAGGTLTKSAETLGIVGVAVNSILLFTCGLWWAGLLWTRAFRF